MTREQAKKLLPIIQAWADGKDVQIWDVDKKQWYTFRDSVLFTKSVDEYRIKQEPKYRPFKNAEECWQEMQKHKPFGWIAKGMKLYAINAVECNTVFIDDDCENRSLLAFFNDGFTFADGTPFGIKEEE